MPDTVSPLVVVPDDILAENGDFLVTEASDNLITESTFTNAYSQTTAEAPTTSESAAAVRTPRSITGTASDALSTAEAATAARTPRSITGTATDALSTSEAATGTRAGLSISRTATDALTTTDVVSRIGSYIRIATDTSATAESATQTKFAFVTRTTTDALTTAEAVTRIGNFKRATTDAPTTAESATATKFAFVVRSTADTPTTVESLARIGSFHPATTDAPTTAEVITKSATHPRTTVDAPTTAEAATGVKVGGGVFTRTASESLATAESAGRGTMTFLRSATDGPTTAEAIIRGKATVRTASDALTTTEAATRIGSFHPVATESPHTSELALGSKFAILARTAGESLSASMIGGAPPYYCALTVQPGQVPSTQTDFPVLVSLTDARLKSVANGGHVQRTDGFDINFAADTAGATPLKWEIDKYDPVTGQLIAYVKISSLSSGTVFYLRYGDPTITTDHSDKANVWDTHFKAVYHLGDGTTLSVADSTGTNPGNNSGAIAAAGQIGGGAWVGPSVGGGYIVDSNVINTPLGTLSLWVKVLQVPASGVQNNLLGLMDGLSSGIHERQLVVDVVITPSGTFSFYAWDGSVHNLVGPGVTIGDWYHLVGVQDGTTATFYVNGVACASASCAGGYTGYSVPNLYLGGYSSGGALVNAVVDEAQFSDIGRSADWVLTQYNNGVAPGAFLSLGAEVATGVAAGAFRVLQAVRATTEAPHTAEAATGSRTTVSLSRTATDVLTVAELIPGLSDNDLVTTWQDKSGNGYDATGSGTARPLFKTNILNSKPIVRFDGVDDILVTANAATTGITSAITVIIVQRTNAIQVSAPLFAYDGPSTTRIGIHLPYVDNSVYFDLGDWTTGRVTAPWGGNTTDFFIWSFVAGGGQMYIYRNGVQIGAVAASNNFLGGGITPFNIAGLAGNFWQNSDMAEIIVCNAAASATDRANVEKGLADKWGLTVAGGTAADPMILGGMLCWWKADTLSALPGAIAVVKTGIVRTATDALTTSEAATITRVLNRSTTDAPVTAEAISKAAGHPRTATDAPATAEAATATRGAQSLTRTATEALSTAEVATGVRSTASVARTATDAPTTAEVASKTATHPRATTDAPITAEVVTGVRGTVSVTRTATDALTTAEAATGIRGAVSVTRTATEALTTAEVISKAATHPRTATDAPVTAEVATKTATHPRTATDNPVIAETVTAIRTGAGVFARATTEAPTITETAAWKITAVRAATDAPHTAEDSTGVRLGLSITRTASDALATADLATGVRSPRSQARTVTDALATAEAASASKFGVVIRNATDALVANQVSNRVLVAGRTTADALSAVLAAGRKWQGARIATDMLTAVDSAYSEGTAFLFIAGQVAGSTPYITSAGSKLRISSTNSALGATVAGSNVKAPRTGSQLAVEKTNGYNSN